MEMPNIEIHGYGTGADAGMKLAVRRVFEDSPEADEIVTTTYPTEVRDLKGKKMPFLRVVATLKELPDILTRLAPLNQDIEVVMLGQWIPKKQAAAALPDDGHNFRDGVESGPRNPDR